MRFTKTPPGWGGTSTIRNKKRSRGGKGENLFANVGWLGLLKEEGVRGVTGAEETGGDTRVGEAFAVSLYWRPVDGGRRVDDRVRWRLWGGGAIRVGLPGG